MMQNFGIVALDIKYKHGDEKRWSRLGIRSDQKEKK